jgi:hypothetical protein
VQLAAGIWGLQTTLIRDNVGRLRTPGSEGLVYVLKWGLYARFRIASEVLPFSALDDLLRDEVRAEARVGFLRIQATARYAADVEGSVALLQRVLDVPDRTELTRRLNLGMHAMTGEQFTDLVTTLSPPAQP